MNGLRQNSVGNQQLLLLGLVLIYLSLGWLFGSYTLLKLTRLRWIQLLLRLGITSGASIVAGALLGGLLGQVIGVRETLLVSAIGLTLAMLIPLLSPLRSLKAIPETPD